MLTGVDLSQRIEFSSKTDTSDPKTVFIIRPLSGVEVLDLAKFLTGNQLHLDKSYVVELLGGAVVEVKNPDITGREKIVEFIVSLSPTVLMELVGETGRINNLTGQEQKN